MCGCYLSSVISLVEINAKEQDVATVVSRELLLGKALFSSLAKCVSVCVHVCEREFRVRER